MRRSRRLARPFAACLATGGVVAAILVALPSAAAEQESLRLVDRSPLTVAGRGFSAGERVRVRAVTGGERAVRRVRASRSGSFRAAFSGLTADACTGLSVTATGSDGSRATLKRPPRECPQPLRPSEQQGGGGGSGSSPPGGACGPPDAEQSIQAVAKRPQPACPPN